LQAYRKNPLTGHDVLFAFFATLGFPILTILILLQLGFFVPLIGPAPEGEAAKAATRIYGVRCGAISSPLSLALTLGILFLMLFVRSGCRPHHLGLSWSRWPANVALGLVAVIVTAPVVLGINALASLVLGEGAHPFTLAAGDIEHGWEWFFLGFQAIVAAPILEEIVFRGVLLGWLRRATLAGHLGVISAAIFVVAFRSWIFGGDEQENLLNVEPLVLAVVLAGCYVYAMYRLVRRFNLQEDEIQAWRPQASRNPDHAEAFWSKEDVDRKWRDANARLAIFGSAMLFAIFHADAWPAPIALLLLALVLGALAMRTQNLVGPIVLHAAFNLISFIALCGMTFQGNARNGNAATTPTAPATFGSIVTSMPTSQLPLRK
jgi:membrane protease YdiL (CAAX protease family)